MKKIILLGFLYLPICIFAQKNYFSITGRTFLEEYIVPNQTTKSPLSAGAYIQIKNAGTWLVGRYRRVLQNR